MGIASTYALPGIRAATTGPQEDLLLRMVEALQADDRILAGYLVGGFAVGQGDAFSDVDMQFVIADAAAPDLATGWTDLVGSVAPPAHVEPFPGVIGGSVITADWLHYDVVFTPGGPMVRALGPGDQVDAGGVTSP